MLNGTQLSQRRRESAVGLYWTGGCVDFETDFYSKYPRKMARAKALKAWNQLSDEDRFAAVHSLPLHIRYWEAAGTSKEFLPYPASFLNGRRWEDELEMPVPKDDMGEWWKSTSGIQRKALSLGMTAKPGEDWHQLKARILAKERAA
jgi:hypothetical protein